MSHDEDAVSDKDREPGPDVTRELFWKWQKARRGSTIAENMTNPVWLWLFRGRVDPYHANERFKSWLSKLLRRIEFPTEPRWAGCRMGQSRTELADGRVFWIAGEHEDYYDPDFFIYNDVIIEQPSGDVQIYGYPETLFPPTDFHSATAIDEDRFIVLIGNVGYMGERDAGRTQVYSLDTESLGINEIVSSGDAPGWISNHEATLSSDGRAIIVRGGKTMFEDGFLENIDEWSLSLDDFAWTRLTKRKWVRFQLSRNNGQRLHLWQYEMRRFASAVPSAGLDVEDELVEEIGTEPNTDAYNELYSPPVEHSKVEPNPDSEDWNAKRLLVDDVIVRYNDEMDHLIVTVEGELPKSTVEAIAQDLQTKLALVENAECRVRWVP